MSSLANLVQELEYEIDDVFLADVVAGLSKDQKTLPCKYFYDELGSQLFEQICETPEYYVTRTELGIYQDHGSTMAEVIGEQALIIEPGAGSVKKIALLLQHLTKPAGFIPMDISPEILKSSSDTLATMFPNVDITPMVADFLNAEALTNFFTKLPALPLVQKRVVFFPGSTIGNFQPVEAKQFLQNFSSQLHTGDGLLIGVDLLKDKHLLEAAYNDGQGVTADFNLNLLLRIANELDGSLSIDDFSHQAVFNSEKSRVEMHLVSDKKQTIYVGDHAFDFEPKETIHTENSYKYSVEAFRHLAAEAGFRDKELWIDKDSLFSVHYLEVA